MNQQAVESEAASVVSSQFNSMVNLKLVPSVHECSNASCYQP